MVKSKSEEAEIIRKRIRNIREEANKTQIEAAELLGVSPTTYPKYETRSDLPITLIGRFCKAFKVSPAYLIYGVKDTFRHQETEEYINAPTQTKNTVDQLQKSINELLGLGEED
jgi:transcriptional regulator with XRE-family HTH domain